MTQVCSLPSSTASANGTSCEKRLPKGINIIGAEDATASSMGGIYSDEEANQSPAITTASTISSNKVSCCHKFANRQKESALPWGYIFIQHMSASTFDKRMETRQIIGDFHPRCFVHRTLRYRKKSNGKGIIKEEVPSVSGLVFLQGTTKQLKSFLMQNFPQYYLVNNCSTGRPASIPDSVMKPFMAVMEHDPERVTFLRDPFIRFAKDHVKLRVLTGLFAGQEGYVVRVKRDRQLVMNLGGYAVAISNVHNEDFEVAE